VIFKERVNVGLSTLLVSILVSALLLAVPVTAAETPSGESGTGPENALVPSNTWKPLGPGVSRWYAFEYAGDGSQIDILLEPQPEGSIAFEVWTPEGIRRRGLGLEADPIGRGSPDPFVPGDLLWSGSFNVAGTYYVVVGHSGNQPGVSFYHLQVEGDGVSTSEPAPAPTPTPAKASKPQPKQPASVKPSGKLAFQTTIGGKFYTINADGTGLQQVTDGIDPIWSPDGKQIAFIRLSEPRGVWVVDVDSTGAPTNEWRAFDWSEARWPSWSQDGSRILFSRLHGGRDARTRCFWGFCFTIGARPNWKLSVIRPHDGDFREPPSSNFGLAPHWSPVEDRIVYDDEQGLRVQSEDESVSYLITHNGQDTAPAWSPDGQRVAFTRRQHDHWELYVVDADGQNPRRLTTTPKKPNGEVGNSVSAAWSPNGQYIAFMTDRTGKWEVWVMRANGADPKPMFGSALDGLPIEYSYMSERAISWTE
jgi:hypothetical protein